MDTHDPDPNNIPRVPAKEEMFLSFQTLSKDDVGKLINQ